MSRSIIHSLVKQSILKEFFLARQYFLPADLAFHPTYKIMTADSNKVVSLTAALLSGNVSTQSAGIRSSKIFRNQTSGLGHRTCAVLDALASLCVREHKSEVISIACRCNEPYAELIITSNNGPPPDATHIHLERIWTSLQAMSNRSHPGKKVPTDSHVKPPEFKITDSFNDTSLHTLFTDIFKHSFKVAGERFTKYWPVLEEFNKQYHGLIVI